MDREPGEEVFFRGHPSWLSMTRLLVKGLIVSLVLGVAAGLASAIAAGRVETSWVIGGVLGTLVLVYAVGQRRRMKVTYAITSHRVTIERRGLISRRVHQARLERIQDVTYRQSLYERVLGIGTVYFETTGELDFAVRFRGVDDPRGIVRAVDGALDHCAGDWGPWVADLRS